MTGKRLIKTMGLLSIGMVLIIFVALKAFQQFDAMVGHTTHAVTEITIAGRQVAIWKPSSTPPPSGYPIILFSHGFTGCDTQSVFLMEALAEAGYFVLAPNHRDAVCGSAGATEGWHPGKLLDKLSSVRSEPSFSDASKWSDATYRDRIADFEVILEVVLHDRSFQGTALDPQRIGMAGHSLGGYTALGMAGAWPSWKDRRIKAVLALSPYCAPYVKKGELGSMGVPVMYQGGTRDLGVTPTVRRLQGAYDLTATPKYYVEFDGAGHFAWTNLNPAYHSAINSYSVAFFNRYLKGVTDPDSLAPLVTSPLPPKVSSVRMDSK